MIIKVLQTLGLMLLINYAALSQNLISVTDEVFTVNSSSAINGRTRNIAEVVLPQKTSKYIYRLSVFPKGKVSSNTPLFDLLKSIGGAEVSLMSSFAKMAVVNNDNNAIDAFIFSNVFDAENFNAKKDDNWTACKSMQSRSSCCFSTEDCIGRRIYFGFRNNNFSQGLDVKLEIVAIVDSSQKDKYKNSYTISNTTGRELKYSISNDGKNWAVTSIRPNYVQTIPFAESEIYFKLYTDNFRFVQYKITPNERYKIIWNNLVSKWDLVRY